MKDCSRFARLLYWTLWLLAEQTRSLFYSATSTIKLCSLLFFRKYRNERNSLLEILTQVTACNFIYLPIKIFLKRKEMVINLLFLTVLLWR